MSLLGRKRARLADRDQVVDALGAAYADGQIDEYEHELRVARALRAVELQTLLAQVHDLQIADDHPAAALLVRRPEPVPGQPTASRPRRSRRWVAVPVAVLVVGVGAGVIGESLSDDGDERLDLLTVACLEDLVEDVEEEFGSTEVVSVELHDTWAWVRVPAEGAGSRFDLYTYSEDGFSQHQGGSLADADPDLVDLTELDLQRLVDRVQEAPERLGMEGEIETVVDVTDAYASTYYASVVHGAEGDVPPHVEIELSNEYLETASVTTDLAGGRILHEQPFERERAGG